MSVAGTQSTQQTPKTFATKMGTPSNGSSVPSTEVITTCI